MVLEVMVTVALFQTEVGEIRNTEWTFDNFGSPEKIVRFDVGRSRSVLGTETSVLISCENCTRSME